MDMNKEMRIEALVDLHKEAFEKCPGAACQALIQTLGYNLHNNEMTAEDVAKVISALYDEDMGRKAEESFRVLEKNISLFASLLGL